MWLTKSHLLVDKIKMIDYNIVNAAEILGIRCMQETFQLCYTPQSSLAPLLLCACEKYKLDHPMDRVTFLGDFNVHNPGWIISNSSADPGGILAEDFGDLFGYNQLIDFPTHNQGNTLDLVFTHCQGVASCRPGLGTSDRYCIELVLEVGRCVPVVPDNEPALLWEHAPWDHIRGAVGRGLEGWDPPIKI